MSRLVAAAGLTQNPALKVLVNLVVPWDFYFAHRLKQYRATLATQVPVWLDRWFELEALISLATFSYLHPTYTFPTIHAGSAEDNRVPFHSVALGHPLIPGERRVCNDFTMDAVGDVVVVTGSNMAGKSSFLRTVGVNLCLAYAGAPVVARALETRRFRLFTSIRVSDSVIDGISYFYAEVVRLRALLTALEQDHPLPLFFLIDEIFRGTNNRERLIGSRAYLRAVTGRNGLGILATHDLELAALAETIPSLRNYHFREFVQDGRMHFDYRLRPGPCPTTNALRIMEMAGLPVD
jgi:DNA mismatch repair ATPase MutS